LAAPSSNASLADLIQTCDEFYNHQGFVKWADVARVFGISRQAVLSRLQGAVDRGSLDPSTLDRWRSMSARAAASRRNREEGREREKLQLRVTVTPENKHWLDLQSALHKASYADLINGLINKAREQT
jgi:hypothetical protein